MTRREIANMCCRVLAVYVIVQGLSQLPQTLVVVFPLFDSMYRDWQMVIELLARGLPPLILIALGAFLWRWSGLIAAWMTGHDLQDAVMEPEAHVSITSDHVHCIAFSTVGLWVLVQSIPLGIGLAMQLLVMSSRGADTDSWSRSGWWVAAVVDVLLRTALGLYLLFGASGLVRLVRSARDRLGQSRYRPADLERSGDKAD